MNIWDRLKVAYENIAYSADRTWINSDHLYQATNLELHVREQRFRFLKIVKLRPRTVSDCIPNSKLAKYSNYEYNESRELSYTPSYSKQIPTKLSEEYKHDKVKEPWMLPEIDNLFESFLYYNAAAPNSQKSDESMSDGSSPHLDKLFESPVFKTSGFEENVLKIVILSDRIKQLWNGSSEDNFYGFGPVTKDKILTVYKSPTQHFFLPKFADNVIKNEDYFWFRNIPECNCDFEHLKHLSESFREQTNWIISNSQERCAVEVVYNESLADSAPNRRLYSAVLQGCPTKLPNSANDNQMTILRKHTMNVEKNKNGQLEDTPSTSDNTSAGVSNMQFSNLPKDCANNSLNSLSSKKISQKLKSTNNSNVTVANNVNTNVSSIFSSSNSNVVYNSNPSHQLPLLNNSVTLAPSYSNYVNNYNNNYLFICQFNANNQITSQYGANNNCFYSQIITNRNFQALPRQTFPSNPYQLPSSVVMRTNTYQIPTVTHQTFPQPPHCSVAPSFIRSSATTPQRAPSYPPSIPAHYVPPPPSHWIRPAQPTATNENQTQKNKLKHLVESHFKNLQGKLRSTSILADDRRNQKKAVNSTRRSTCSCSGLEVGASCSKVGTKSKNFEDFEEVVAKTVGVVFEESGTGDSFLPIQASASDDLEIQALEQYNNSTDNVYQELERQAAEQYEEYSENYKDPPINWLFVGGFLIQFKISLKL